MGTGRSGRRAEPPGESFSPSPQPPRCPGAPSVRTPPPRGERKLSRGGRALLGSPSRLELSLLSLLSYVCLFIPRTRARARPGGGGAGGCLQHGFVLVPGDLAGLPRVCAYVTQSSAKISKQVSPSSGLEKPKKQKASQTRYFHR